MQEKSFTTDLSLKVAIIGSGPSGFYTAEELFSQAQSKIFIDMFDRLPTPFGLVRGGVAPDHQKIKSVIKIYEKIASRKEFRFLGNVEFGRDLAFDDIQKYYDAIIFAVGARTDKKMNIPGENLKGSEAATSFVGWYNGHPDYRTAHYDLSNCERVAVVVNGNVAMDVTRILALDPVQLEQTDIVDYALDQLKKSKVKEIFVLGRRGVAQASFTNPEIRELCNLKGADLVVAPQEVELDELTKEMLSSGSLTMKAKENIDILTQQSKLPLKNESKKIYMKFLVSPVEIFGQDGKVTAVKLEKNRLYKEKDGSLRPNETGQYEILPIDLILRSVGYKGVALPNIPYDENKGTIPNESGRVINTKTQKPIFGLYVVGWAKRGPNGVIGTNKLDANETVKKLLEDVQKKTISFSQEKHEKDIKTLLKQKSVRFVSYADWKQLDELEIQNGTSKGKVREKFTTVEEMISVLDQQRSSTSSQ